MKLVSSFLLPLNFISLFYTLFLFLTLMSVSLSSFTHVLIYFSSQLSLFILSSFLFLFFISTFSHPISHDLFLTSNSFSFSHLSLTSYLWSSLSFPFHFYSSKLPFSYLFFTSYTYLLLHSICIYLSVSHLSFFYYLSFIYLSTSMCFSLSLK